MKKYRVLGFICIIFIFCILLVSLAYAVGAQEKDISLKNIQVTEINTETTKKNELIGTTKKININNNITEVIYQETKFENDIYRDNETNDEYIFKDEKMVGFIKKVNITQEKNIINQEKAKQFAEEFAHNNITNFDKYKLEISNYTESYGEYCFIYIYQINNINTSDIIQINVDTYGNIISYSGLHQGEFKKYENLFLDLNIINSTIDKTIKDKYTENLKEYKITNQFLRLINEKLTVQSDIIVTFNNAEPGLEIISDIIIYEIE